MKYVPTIAVILSKIEDHEIYEIKVYKKIKVYTNINNLPSLYY